MLIIRDLITFRNYIIEFLNDFILFLIIILLCSLEGYRYLRTFFDQRVQIVKHIVLKYEKNYLRS